MLTVSCFLMGIITPMNTRKVLLVCIFVAVTCTMLCREAMNVGAALCHYTFSFHCLTTQVGHVKTGCCMAALWLSVFNTSEADTCGRLTSASGDDARTTNVPTYTCARNLLGNGQKYLRLRTKTCTKRYKVTVAILGIRAASASSLRMQSIAQLSVRSSIQVT